MRSMILPCLVALAASASAAAVPAAEAAPAAPSATVGPVVYVGTHETPSGASEAVNRFAGIPYAVSPPERFLPPQPPSGIQSPFQANTLPPACLQQFITANTERVFNNPNGPAPAESEDCLYLNIWTPPGTTANSSLPVMFWIYGGNLQFGTGSLPYYDGASFAYNQDIIMVTHNYRTNVFGFSSAPEIPVDQQNAGYYDQRMALDWVYQNIANFGGDASKITIFGESAGGYSVKQLLANPPDPLPFRAAIMESQAVSSTGSASEEWELLSTELGCATLACMQQANASEILALITAQEMSFTPVDDGGVTQTSDVTPLFTSGKAAPVPFMLGNNANEGRVFAYILGFDQPGDNAVGNLTTFLQSQFPNDPALQATLMSIYAGSQTPYLAVSEILTDFAFLCTAAALAELGTSTNHKVWRYLFDAAFPNVGLFPDPGVYHSSEIPEVFGTYPGNNQYGDQTQAEVKLSQYMQTAWANFAKQPTVGPGWTEYSNGNQVANLGGINPNGATLVSASSIDGNCVLYDAIIAADGP